MKVANVQLIFPATVLENHHPGIDCSLRAFLNWITNDKNAIILDWETETYEDDSFEDEDEEE